jgi:hypothetical protein
MLITDKLKIVRKANYHEFTVRTIFPVYVNANMLIISHKGLNQNDKGFILTAIRNWLIFLRLPPVLLNNSQKHIVLDRY